MPAKRKAAARKPAKSKKSSATRSARKRGAPAGPLVDVARKIGTTLGEVAVRTGIVKPGSDEPSGQ